MPDFLLIVHYGKTSEGNVSVITLKQVYRNKIEKRNILLN